MNRSCLALLLLFTMVACGPAPSVAPSASPTGSLTPLGGTLRVGVAREITTLDPWTASDADSYLVLRQVFETLVDLEPGGYRIVPKLAQRWTTSSDGRVWTFTLRSGVRFHDGTTFDAAAVVATFDRLKGSSRSDLLALLTGVEATSANTVVLTLSAPFAPLLATIASPAFGIASPACLKQGPSWASPASRCAAGTGPFRLEPGAWQPGDRVTLVRSASYWATDGTGQRLPYLDSIVFRLVGDETARVGALKSASLEAAFDLGPASVRALRGDPNTAVSRRPLFETSYLGIAAGPRPLDQPEVRRAIAMAIDRAAIVQTVYGGDARAASQLIPPDLLGHDDTITQFTASDPSGAKKLLADAGLPQGFTTELWYTPSFSPALPDPKRIADAIAADLGRIGITLTVRADDPDGFAAHVKAGTLPLWIGARVPDRADPDDFVADASADRVTLELVRRARGESDASKRAELYKQVTKLLQQEIARIPLFDAGASFAANRKIKGLVPQAVGGESFAAVSFGK